MSSPTDLTATVSSGAVVVVSANVVAVVVVEGSTVVDVVVVSAAVEAHADAMIAIAAKPTVAARWLGRVVSAADVKRVTSYQLPARSLRSLPVPSKTATRCFSETGNWQLATGNW